MELIKFWTLTLLLMLATLFFVLWGFIFDNLTIFLIGDLIFFLKKISYFKIFKIKCALKIFKAHFFLQTKEDYAIFTTVIDALSMAASVAEVL